MAEAAKQIIDLTGDSGDDAPIRRPFRPIRPLPKKTVKAVAPIIISSDDDEFRVIATVSTPKRIPDPKPVSRKGKEVDRSPLEAKERKEGNEPPSIYEPTHQRLGPASSSVSLSSSTANERQKTGPKVRPAQVDPVLGDRQTLLRTLNDSRRTNEKAGWEYGPSRSEDPHVALFKCTWPAGCRASVMYQDVASDGKRWRHKPLPSKYNTHDHPRSSQSTLSTSSVRPSLRTEQRADATGSSSQTRGKAARTNSDPTKAQFPSRHLSPVKAATDRTGQSVAHARGFLRQKTLSFASDTTEERHRKRDRSVEADTSRQASGSKTWANLSLTPHDASADRAARAEKTPTSANTASRGKSPETEKTDFVTPTDRLKAGEKRKHQGAFGSHRKRERSPGSQAIGRELRQKLLESPGQVSDLIPLESIPRSPWVPKGAKMDRKANRSNTSIASSRTASPTPAQSAGGSRMSRDALLAGPSSTQPRASSPLKRSLPTNTSTPKAPIATTTSATPGPVVADPSKSSRSKRPRPAAGTYTVPSMGAAQWPSTSGSSGKDKQSSSRSHSHPTSTKQSATASTPGGVSKRNLTASASASRIGASFTPSRSSEALAQSKTKTTNSQHATPKSAVATPRRLGASVPKPPTSIRKSAGPASISRTPAKTRTKRAQSPEEEEELVEDPGPENADDLLAEFDDFQFDTLSPMQSTKSINGDVPHTPSQRSQRLPSTTPRTAMRTVPRTPESQTRALTDTSKVNLRTPSKQMSQIIKDPSVALSPQLVKFNTKAKNSLIDNILAGAAKQDEELKRRKEEKEARDKRMEALLRQEKELDESLAAVALDLVIPEEEESVEIETGSRRSARIRSNSIESRASSKAPSRPPSRQESRKSRSRGRSRKLDASTRFFQEQERLKGEGRGIGEAERALEAIRQGKTAGHSTLPYPTPESDRDSSPDSDDAVVGNGVNVELLEEHEELGGVLDVAREAQVSKQTSTGSTDEPEWEGFWLPLDDDSGGTDAQPSVDSHDTEGKTSPRSIIATIAATVPHLSGLMWRDGSTASNTQAAGLESPKLIDQMTNVLADPQCQSAQGELTGVLHGIRSAENDPFGKAISLCCSLLTAYSARPDITNLDNGRVVPKMKRTPARRAMMCDLLIQVLDEVVRRPWFTDHFKLASVILLLAVDPTTSVPLRRDIEDLLDRCWTSQSPNLLADWAARHDSLPTGVKVQIVQVIGPRTPLARSVAQRVATTWLMALEPEALKSIEDQPNVQWLVTGGERILRMACQADTPFESLGDHITLLYEAMSDLETLIGNTKHDHSDRKNAHPAENLKALIRMIRESLRSKGDDAQMIVVSKLRARLFALESILEMQYRTISMRMAQERLNRRLEKKGLNEGKNGQTTLALKKG